MMGRLATLRNKNKHTMGLQIYKLIETFLYILLKRLEYAPGLTKTKDPVTWVVKQRTQLICIFVIP